MATRTKLARADFLDSLPKLDAIINKYKTGGNWSQDDLSKINKDVKGLADCQIASVLGNWIETQMKAERQEARADMVTEPSKDAREMANASRDNADAIKELAKSMTVGFQAILAQGVPVQQAPVVQPTMSAIQAAVAGLQAQIAAAPAPAAFTQAQKDSYNLWATAHGQPTI